MSKMSEQDIKNQNAIRDQEEEVLIHLLQTIGDWFAGHEQAAEDCREYLEEMDMFDRKVLDALFGAIGLPDEVSVSVEDFQNLGVEDFTDEDEMSDTVVEFLTQAFGFCVKGCDWDYDTQDSGDIQRIIISNIDWDLDD